MRHALWLVLTGALPACTFDRSGLSTVARDGGPDAVVIDAAPPDAGPDAAPDAAPDASPCPMSYAPIPGGQAGSQYRVVTSGKAWLDAEHDCEVEGTHLVVLGDDAERDAVRGAVSGNTWVGVSDRVAENTWLRVTSGVATYLPWKSGEPNDFFGEDCVEMVNSSFNDADCGTTNVYVCECDQQPADPLAYTPP